MSGLEGAIPTEDEYLQQLQIINQNIPPKQNHDPGKGSLSYLEYLQFVIFSNNSIQRTEYIDVISVQKEDENNSNQGIAENGAAKFADPLKNSKISQDVFDNPDRLDKENQSLEDPNREGMEIEHEESVSEEMLCKRQDFDEEEKENSSSFGGKERFLDMKNEEIDYEVRDYMMAKELQEKLDIEAIEMEVLREEEEKQNEIDCMICIDGIISSKDKFPFPLGSCKHIFHADCLEGYLPDKIKERNFPIKCPIPDCKAEISEQDIKDLLQNNLHLQEMYDQNWIQLFMDSHPKEYFHCLTPDCKFVCSVLGDRFDCQFCKKSYCVNCKVEWHNNMFCEDFQEQKKNQTDEAYKENANRLGYKPCPTCNFFYERTSGCNAMVCTRCKTPFCYQCGKKGDGHSCSHQ